jgi:hypothetical protein
LLFFKEKSTVLPESVSFPERGFGPPRERIRWPLLDRGSHSSRAEGLGSARSTLPLFPLALATSLPLLSLPLCLPMLSPFRVPSRSRRLCLSLLGPLPSFPLIHVTFVRLLFGVSRLDTFIPSSSVPSRSCRLPPFLPSPLALFPLALDSLVSPSFVFFPCFLSLSSPTSPLLTPSLNSARSHHFHPSLLCNAFTWPLWPLLPV